MRKVLALVRAAWLTALSYRLETFFSFMSLIVAVIPLFFIGRALQPMMSDAIRAEAPEYFGFVIVGLITLTFVQTAVSAPHSALAGEISTGSFEALLATPTSIPELLAGMIGQGFSMTAIRAVVVLAFSAALGAHVVWSAGGAAIVILTLIVLAYLPYGIASAALVLAFRTTGPFPSMVVGGAALLGGVYYPTHVIPVWLEGLSTLVPLTYGLRALRRSLLDGAPLAASAADLTILATSTIVLMIGSLAAFSWALRYSKRAGTLAQY